MEDYQWDWGIIFEYAPAFINGTLVTLVLTSVAIFFGTILGLALGLAIAPRTNPSKPFRIFCGVVVEIVRALPVLVFLVWLHYVTPWGSNWLYHLLRHFESMCQRVFGDSMLVSSITSRAFATSVIAFSLNLAAFVADIIRSGIQNVPTELIDAAKSLGMNSNLRIRRVILPAAMRASASGLVAMYITIFKFTTLAAFIGCNELMNVTFTAGNVSYRYLELYTVLALIYLAILLPITRLAQKIEKSEWMRHGR